MKSEYNKGYVKLWRSIAQKQWWNEFKTSRLMIVILLNANWEDRICDGIEVKRGSLLTSYRSLAKMSGLSVQEIRTALNHLEATHDITRTSKNTSTNHYTLITVENYDVEQGGSEKPTHLSTHDSTHDSTLNKKDTKKIYEEDINKNNSVVDFNELLSADEIHRLYSQYDNATDLIEYVQADVNSKGKRIKASAYKYICGVASNTNWPLKKEEA